MSDKPAYRTEASDIGGSFFIIMSPTIKLRGKPSSASVGGVLVFVICTLKVARSNVQDNIVLMLPLLVVLLLVSLFFLFVEPINQHQKYHDFADKRFFLCACHSPSEGLFLPPNSDVSTNRSTGFIIPNWGDVISNMVILVGGLMGAILLCLKDNEEVDEIRSWQLEVCLPIFFYSTIAISFGSSYYHWKPSNQTLVWDRLGSFADDVGICVHILLHS